MPSEKPAYRDRNRVSPDDVGDVEDFAAQYDLTTEQVLDLIKQYGSDRKKLIAAARRIQERF